MRSRGQDRDAATLNERPWTRAGNRPVITLLAFFIALQIAISVEDAHAFLPVLNLFTQKRCQHLITTKLGY